MECYVILLKLDWLGGDFYFGVRFFFIKKKKRCLYGSKCVF